MPNIPEAQFEKPPLEQGEQLSPEMLPPEQTKAELLGLPADVIVKRSSGEMESGWAVEDFGVDTHPETGEQYMAVTVTRPSEELGGKFLAKRLPFADLASWNEPVEDDTIPREQLPRPDVAAPAEEPTPDAVPQEPDEVAGVMELAGDLAASAVIGTALPESERGPASQQSNDQQAVAQPIAAEQSPEMPERPRVEQAMTELRDSWGLPEEATPEMAVQKIDQEVDRVEGMLRMLYDFDGVRRTSLNQLQASLNEGKMALFGSNRQALESLVHDKRFGELQRMASGQEQAFLPAGIRSKLSELGRGLTELRNGFEAMNSRGPNFIEPDGAQRTMRSLRQLPEATQQLSIARRQLEEMRVNLKGVTSVEQQAADKEIMYRNEQVQRWATELQGEVSPERLEELTQEIETAVAIESSMVDDPNSPSRWFGDRVMDNRMKPRHAVSRELGRGGEDVPSQQYVAELMADMLRGKFDASRASDPIEIDPKQIGGIKTSQHRAAALAMLYGHDWIKATQRMGMKVIRT